MSNEENQNSQEENVSTDFQQEISENSEVEKSQDDAKKRNDSDSSEESKKEEPTSQEIIEGLNVALEDAKNALLRKAADFDNYRKRSIKEKQDAIDYANSNLLVDMITVVDDFERAIKAGENSDINSFKEGVVMIKDKMLSILDSKYDLKRYESLNQPFNPEIHEALGSVSTEEVEEPTVGEVYLEGYKLKGRVVRAAKVMVKMPATKESEN